MYLNINLGSEHTYFRLLVSSCYHVLDLCGIEVLNHTTYTKPPLRVPVFLDLGSCLDAFISLVSSFSSLFFFLMMMCAGAPVWTSVREATAFSKPVMETACPLSPQSPWDCERAQVPWECWEGLSCQNCHPGQPRAQRLLLLSTLSQRGKPLQEIQVSFGIYRLVYSGKVSCWGQDLFLKRQGLIPRLLERFLFFILIFFFQKKN